MAETDTITRNAVQELLELPVAREPKDVIDAAPPHFWGLSPHERGRLYQGTWEHEPTESLLLPEYQARAQKLIDCLAQIPIAEQRRQCLDRRREQLKGVSFERLQYVYGGRHRFGAICMPSRHRLLGL